MEKWINKVAVVTGASSGLGKDIALKLVDSGLKVIGCGRNLDSLMEVKNEIPRNSIGEFTPFKCDVSKEEDVISLFKFVKDKFKELSILINSAGIALNSSILYGKTEDFKDQLDINVLGLCMCTREGCALIRENEKSGKTSDEVAGHIINMNSLLGHSVLPYTVFHFYAATKFAVNAITEATRLELKEANSKIKITQISPGMVDTNFTKNSIGEEGESQLKKVIEEPLQASDVTSAIIFALSADPRTLVNDILMRSIYQ